MKYPKMKKYYTWSAVLLAVCLAATFFLLKTRTTDLPVNGKLLFNETSATGSLEQTKESNPAVENFTAVAKINGNEKISNNLNHKTADSASSDGLTPKEIWDSEYAKKKQKRKAGYSKADKPDLFTQYFKDITTRIGEKKSGYRMNYKTIELEKARKGAVESLKHSETLNWEIGRAHV